MTTSTSGLRLYGARVVLYRVLAVLGWPLASLVFRPQVRGREHLPAEGGVVLAPSHLSGWDIGAMAYALAPRPLRNMGKNQLFRRPLLGPVIRSLGAFPAHDEKGLPGGVAAASALAAAGQAVVIFPEGARRRRDGKHSPRTGAARSALAARVPLVPVGLRGTDGWRRLRRWRIAFGPPIPLDDLRDDESTPAAREATRRLWEAITALEATLAAEPGWVERRRPA